MMSNINEQRAPTVARGPDGKIGVVLIDTKTGKPIPGSWRPKDDPKVKPYLEPGGKGGYKLDPQKFKQEEDKRKAEEAKRKAEAEAKAKAQKPPAKPSTTPAPSPSPTPASSGGDTRPAPTPTKPSGTTTTPAPAAPKPSPVADYMKAAAAARKSGDPAEMAKVRDMGMDIWRKSNPKLAAAAAERERIRGTAQTDNPLMKDMRSGLPVTPTVQAPAVKDLGSGQQSLSQNKFAGRSPEPAKPAPAATPQVSAKATPEMNKVADELSKNPLGKKKEESVKKEAYDVVLDYILSEGHADTLSEAHYVMLQMDSEHIQNIVQERWSWNPMDWGKPEATPKNVARAKPTRGYDPNTGTTQIGTKEKGYTPKIMASRGGVAGAMVKGKPETWTPVISNDPGVKDAYARYRTLRGTAQLDKDAKNNAYVSAVTKDFDRRYADVYRNPAPEREGLGPRPEAPAPKPAVKAVATAPVVAKPKPPTIQSKNVTATGTSYERRTPTSAELAAAKAAGGGEAGVKAAVDVAKSNKVAATSPTPDLKPEAPKKRESLAAQLKDLQTMRKAAEERNK